MYLPSARTPVPHRLPNLPSTQVSTLGGIERQAAMRAAMSSSNVSTCSPRHGRNEHSTHAQSGVEEGDSWRLYLCSRTQSIVSKLVISSIGGMGACHVLHELLNALGSVYTLSGPQRSTQTLSTVSHKTPFDVILGPRVRRKLSLDVP